MAEGYRGANNALRRERWKIIVRILLSLILANGTLLMLKPLRHVFASAVNPSSIAVYGQGGSFTSNTVNAPSGVVSAVGLNGPRRIVFDSGGNVYIDDTTNNRVLYYAAGSTTATRVYGQLGSFSTNVINDGGAVSADSLYSPRNAALDSGGNLYIADTRNNRVLYYAAGSTTATRVYGQLGSFSASGPNNGGVSADSLSSPTGLALDSSNNLYIADMSNNRVLYYAAGSTTATRVYGQLGSFSTNASNNGGVSADSLRAPRSVTLDHSRNVYVADSPNNRVLYYPAGSTTATVVYGQLGSFTTTTANNGGISATSLDLPYEAIADDSGNVYIADNLNSRVLFFPAGSTTATRVYGQLGSFTSGNLDNGGLNATSLYQPTGMTIDGNGDLYISDNLNNRALEFQTSLSVTVQSPVGVAVNGPFSISVQVIDVGSGSLYSDFSGTVSIAIKAGTGTAGATLNGTTSIPVVNGVATFNNLSINTAGNGYILTATIPGTGSVNTSPLDVGALLFLTPLTNPSFAVTLTGSPTILTSQHTFTVTDTTASGVGWHMLLTSTQFTMVSGNTLPTTATTITGVTFACVGGQSCVVPVNSISSYPLTMPADTTPPAAVNYFSANPNTGTGDVALTVTFALTIPPGTASGTYTSTFTETLVKGQ